MPFAVVAAAAARVLIPESTESSTSGPIDVGSAVPSLPREVAVGATFGAVITFAGTPSGRWQLDSDTLRHVADLFEAGLPVSAR